MPRCVAILEDDPDRRAAMQAVLADCFAGATPLFFEDSAGMILWLEDHLPEADLISLDHDLPFWRSPEGEVTDAGCGREVADYLADRAPTCPVIVHSSNEPCAQGMMRVLRDAAWPVFRVVPAEDVSWVAGDWLHAIADLRQCGWIDAS